VTEQFTLSRERLLVEADAWRAELLASDASR
jgi:hypothetical protein